MPRLPHPAVRSTAIVRGILLVAVAVVTLAVAVPGQARPIALHEVRTWQSASLRGPASTAWTAEILATVKARVAPRPDAQVRTVLRSYTPYSTAPARFMATAASRDARGRDWVRVEIAERPNASYAWVPADAVQLETTDVRIVVRLGLRRLELWRNTRRVATYRAGIGRSATPTPIGTFAVEDKVVTKPADRRKYGRFILTLTAHSSVLKTFMGGDAQIAIHGSGSLGRIGRASSYGCVVLGDAPLETLFRTIQNGTPVIVTR